MTPNDHAWANGLIPMIAAEEVSQIISGVSDIALVLGSDGVVMGVMTNPNFRGQSDTKAWEGAPLTETLTIESVPKLTARLESIAKRQPDRFPLELNHKAHDQFPEFPVRYSFHKVGTDGAVLMLGADLRSTAEMQQQLVNAQIALEQDYEAQRDNDLKLRALMAVMDEPMLFVSVRSGNVIDANAAAADLFGRKASDLTGAGFHTMVEGKGPGGLIDKLVSVAGSQSGGPVKATATGQHTPIHLSPKMLRTSQDQILLCKLSSPTIVRASNDTLTDNLSDLFDNGVDAMVFAAQDGTVLSTNTAFLKLADVAHPQNVQGQSLSQFLARGSVDVGVIIGNAKRSGAMRLYATKIKSELGTDRPVEISTTRLRASDTPVYALIIRDASRVEAIRPGSSNVADVDMRSVIEYIGNQSLKDIVAQTTDVVEKMCIETAVEMTSNNRVAAAEMLGLSRQSLYVKLRKYGLVKKD